MVGDQDLKCFERWEEEEEREIRNLGEKKGESGELSGLSALLLRSSSSQNQALDEQELRISTP